MKGRKSGVGLAERRPRASRGNRPSTKLRAGKGASAVAKTMADTAGREGHTGAVTGSDYARMTAGTSTMRIVQKSAARSGSVK